MMTNLPDKLHLARYESRLASITRDSNYSISKYCHIIGSAASCLRNLFVFLLSGIVVGECTCISRNSNI